MDAARPVSARPVLTTDRDALLSTPAAVSALRPPWLRPVALTLVVAAHVALFLEAKTAPLATPELDSLEVGLVALGDAEQDQKPQADIQPAAPPPEVAPPAREAELTAPPPEHLAPDAPALPVAKPKPLPKPQPVVDDEEDEPSPAELRRIARKKQEAEERRREAQEARQEARRGAAHGVVRANGMSKASYAGLVLAELNRRKFFPAAARAAGVTGAVGVAFTIGPSGRVVSASITRSSGDSALDGAARAILGALHAPPPPGGAFSTATSIRFNLN